MSDLEFSAPRRTSPLTALVRGSGVFPFVWALLLGPTRTAADRLDVPVALVALVGALAFLVVLVGIGSVSWWRLTFWLDGDGDLRVDSGLLQRSSRRLQLSRLQNVDVVSPIVARVFGLVELRVEVAGSGDSHVVLRYLPRSEADRLRETILASARRHDGAKPVEAQLDESRILAQVPTGRLLAGLLMRSLTVGLLIASVLFVMLTLVTEGASGLILAILTGGVPLLAVVGEFLTYYGFTVSQTNEGLRVRHGLLSTQARTIPPGRVHAVELIAPLLWRWRGWVRVRLTIAGVGAGTDEQRGREVLLPVAPRAEAEAVISLVLPGVDLESLEWVSAPRAARWRSPVQWRQLAYCVTPSAIATRSGRVTRRVDIAPHARVQSVRVTRGPWQELLALASVHADTAPGPVRVVARHLPERQARQLADAEAARVLDATLAVQRSATPRLPWSSAWRDAATGEHGFWQTQAPAAHFTTGSGPVLAEAMVSLLADIDRRLGHEDSRGAPHSLDVVDVGAGEGLLLAEMDRLLAGSDLGARSRLIGIDVRRRPDILPASIGWVTGQAPDALAGLGNVRGLVMAHEWLDEIPCDVVERDGDGVDRLVLVDAATGAESPGPAVADDAALAALGIDGPALRAWLSEWWPLRDPGDRAEIGSARAAAWARLCSLLDAGTALAVDYAHDAVERSTVHRHGTLTGYRDGRIVRPVPDGTVNLTAHVAVDACAASSGRGRSGTQREALDALGIARGLPDPSRLPAAEYADGLARATQVRQLRDPSGMGSFAWLRYDVP